MMCRHIVCVLPYCASCDALEDLIDKNRGKFKNLCDYQIINISGLEGAKKYNSSSRIKSVIRSKEEAGYKTMTLTVNRMLTGSTVPEWDTMMFFKDTASAQEYDQAIFRLQSQYIKECRALNKNKDSQNIIKINQKPQTLLIDFDPVRMFQLQEYKAEVCDILKGKSGGKVLHDTIKKELEVSPIIAVNAGKMVQVEAADIVKEVRNYAGNKSVMDEAADLPVDMNLLKYPQIHEIVQNQDEIGGKKGLTIDPHKGKTSELDTKTERERKQESGKGQGGGNTSNVTPKDLPADEQQKLEKKFKTYFMRILFYAYLTSDSVTSLSDIIHSLKKDENGRIAENLELDADILNLLNQKMDGFKLNCLDMKIHNINDLANDHALEPLDRAINALKRFDRFGSSEVRTPDEVCKKMVDMIPEGVLSEIANKKGRILDIAAKSGEFAIALYRKLTEIGVEPKIIKDMIYSIPTSGVSYEFTRKIYEILGFNIHNLAAQFTSYSLLDEIKKQGKDDKRLVNVLCQDKPFNCITLSGEEIENESENENMKFDFCLGNPPYQMESEVVSKSNGQRPRTNVFHFFQIGADIICKRSSVLIYPGGRWIHRSGKGLKQFGLEQINDQKLSRLVFYPQSKDVFKNTDIPDGVSIVLKNTDKGKSGFVYTYIHGDNEESVFVNQLGEVLLPLNPKDISIANKIGNFVKNNNLEYLHEGILSRSLFGIESDFVQKHKATVREYIAGEEIDNQTEIKVFTNDKAGSAGRSKWFIADKNIVKKNHNFVSEWQVVVSSAHPGGQDGRDNQLSIIDNHSIFGRSRVALKSFKTKKEANNFARYINSKVIKYAFLLTDESLSSLAKRVPDIIDYSNSQKLIDFSENIDVQLCNLIGINKGEFSYIDSLVK